MTQEEILRYAYKGAICEWNIEYMRLYACPDDELASVRLANMNAVLDEIRDMMKGE